VRTNDAIAVRLLGPGDARDARLVDDVAALINVVDEVLATPCDLEVHEKPLRP